MKQKLVPILALCLSAAGSGAAAAAEDTAGLIPPPAIYMPYGGEVVTEINISDSDILGIIKQTIPAVSKALRDVVCIAQEQGRKVPPPLAMAAAIDVTGLMEALEGISTVRVLVARYERSVPPDVFLEQFSYGVAKAGTFSKVISDFGFSPGAVALYAQPDNAGYIAVFYNVGSREAYAARIVGFVDVPKLVQWAADTAKIVIPMGMRIGEQQPEQEKDAEPEPPPAVEEAPGPPEDGNA